MRQLLEVRDYILGTRIGTALLWVSIAGAVIAAIHAATLNQWNVAFWASLAAGWGVMFKIGHAIIIMLSKVIDEQRAVLAAQRAVTIVLEQKIQAMRKEQSHGNQT